MPTYRALRFIRRPAFVSSLFGFTFFATVLTVSTSNILPCPARHNKNRFAESELKGASVVGARPSVTVAKRPKRWIEENHPALD
ncbi:hypothetical protein L208DRAFT_1412894 [Tricholoma matsutake]|nr:hypothetical protein L208DRAFT_1412894 [Tricholoma matsutake 945]